MQYSRAKGFDTFAPIGRCIARGRPLDPVELPWVEGWVNGETPPQSQRTRELIFPGGFLARARHEIHDATAGRHYHHRHSSGVGPLAPGNRT